MISIRRLLVPALVGALAARAQCTILIRKDLRDLTREAEAVARVVVRSNAAAWNKERTLIWTHTALDVVETWKGALPSQVDLAEIGGEVGDRGIAVAGAPRYRVGDTVVIFLYHDQLGQWRTLGWGQGRMSVSWSAARRVETATAEFPHVVEGFVPRAVGAGAGVVDLAALKAKVAELAAAAKPANEKR